MFGTFCYASMLIWVVSVDGRAVPDAIALAKIAFVFAGGLYVALTSRGVELRRGYLANAIRKSRDLIRKLETQSTELAAARQRAEEASAAKSEFLANMSHEMRTPLHGIIGMLQLAIDTETSAERARQLDMARRSAETLLATIGDILDFSKIEARRLELEPVYFSMRQLITDTLKTLGITAAEKGLTLAFAVSPEVPDRLWGDPLRIRQIVVNLVGNALKFTNRGDVVVRVSCEVMSADRVTIGFEVRDTGVGIDPSRRHLIFDPFAQADSSHSRRYGGSGLGLAIVARLLEAMGGVVTFESEQGKGSTFRFVLPMPCEPVGHGAAAGVGERAGRNARAADRAECDDARDPRGDAARARHGAGVVRDARRRVAAVDPRRVRVRGRGREHPRHDAVDSAGAGGAHHLAARARVSRRRAGDASRRRARVARRDRRGPRRRPSGR